MNKNLQFIKTMIIKNVLLICMIAGVVSCNGGRGGGGGGGSGSSPQEPIPQPKVFFLTQLGLDTLSNQNSKNPDMCLKENMRNTTGQNLFFLH